VTSTQWINLISGLFGGLGLFIFGMKLMSEALQKSAGHGLKKTLEKLTSNRIVGTFVGLCVTAVIQSSSATTVMVVGFVNAGLMNLTQALSVVLGANLGTTVTAQLIAFKISNLALPAVGLGVILKMFSKNVMKQYWGEILIGFGLIFIGMKTMEHGFVPMRNSQEFKTLFVMFSANPLLAVFAGTVLTVIVQSSSATIGITIALASTGLIDFYGASALVLGENIGTTVTANLSAIGANKTAKQAAFGHFLINFLGVVYMLFMLKYMVHIVDYLTPNYADFIAEDGSKPFIARHIANLHTSFNLINMVIFLPFLQYLAKICEKIIKPESSASYSVVRLSDNIMSTPAIAVEQAHREVLRMSSYSRNMIIATKQALVYKDESMLPDIPKNENYLDQFDKDISAFLVKLSMKNISESSARQINSMHHIVHNLEKIGDYSESIYSSIKKIKKKSIVFSAEAESELKTIFEVVERFFDSTIECYKNLEAVPRVDTEDEDNIDALRKKFKKNHVKRLNSGECSIDAGLLYVDILNNLEKIGDHTFNIAQVIISAENTHRFNAY
jgi:phosphate:Na+ symporter